MTHEMPDSIDIDLPDLLADATIRADNIRAVQAVYFAAQLEALKIFEVSDVVGQRLLTGALPLSQESANQVADYLRDRPNRLTDRERRSLYSLALGMPGGDPAPLGQNREFDDLWLRFLSSVEAFVRQAAPDSPLGGESLALREVRRAGRDLAVNLSFYGYGIGHFAAAELQTEIKTVVRLLSIPEILHAFGAQDLWQLIDRIASSDLGGALNVVRSRTMATSGAVIIRWIAERVPVLTSDTAEAVLDVHALGGAPSASPMVTPTDRDLVDACLSWFAVAAVT